MLEIYVIISVIIGDSLGMKRNYCMMPFILNVYAIMKSLVVFGVRSICKLASTLCKRNSIFSKIVFLLILCKYNFYFAKYIFTTVESEQLL